MTVDVNVLRAADDEMRLVVALDVMLTEPGKTSPGNVGLLLATDGGEESRLIELEITELDRLDGEKELMLLDVVFVKITDDGLLSVILLLDIVIGVVEKSGGGVMMAEVLVELDDDTERLDMLLLELADEFNPGASRVVVVRVVADDGMLTITMTEEVDIILLSVEGSDEELPKVELRSAVEIAELAIGEGEGTFEALDEAGSDAEELVTPLDDSSLGTVKKELVVPKLPGNNGGDNTLDEETTVNAGDEVVPDTIPEVGIEDVKVTSNNEEISTRDVEPVADDGEEGSDVVSVESGYVENPKNGELTGAAGDVAVMIVVDPELIIVNVVMTTLALLLTVGPGSGTVKPPLDGLATVLEDFGGLPAGAVEDGDETAKDVAPPTMVVSVLTDVVICPPGRVAVSATEDAVIILDALDPGRVALRTVVEASVTVRVWPPEKLLVIDMGRLEAALKSRLDETDEGATLEEVAEILSKAVPPLGRVDEGMMKLLDIGGKLRPVREPNGDLLTMSVGVLVRTDVFPPGMMLVIIKAELDIVTEVLGVASSIIEDAVALPLLVIGPRELVETDGSPGL